MGAGEPGMLSPNPPTHGPSGHLHSKNKNKNKIIIRRLVLDFYSGSFPWTGEFCLTKAHARVPCPVPCPSRDWVAW